MNKFKLIGLLIPQISVLVLFFREPQAPPPNEGAPHSLEGMVYQSSVPVFQVEEKIAHPVENKIPSSVTKTPPLSKIIKRKKRSKMIPATLGTSINSQRISSEQKQPTENTSIRNPYKYYEDFLNSSDRTRPLNQLLRRDDLILSLLQISPQDEFILVKFSLSNNANQDFYISSVNIFGNDTPFTSEFFVPFSCPSHSEIFGIVKFSRKAVQNRHATFILAESGNKYRKLSIKEIDYPF